MLLAINSSNEVLIMLIERLEGLRNVVIDCPFFISQAMSMWKISSKAYYSYYKISWTIFNITRR